MPARLKKLIGSLGVLAFLAAYICAVTLLADHLPRSIWAETAFYLAAGVLWGVPLIPLIRWMNREPRAG